MPPPRTPFQEDPELMQLMQGSGSFQEDPELLSASQPEPAQSGPTEDAELEQYAGKTIELPEQRISADAPWHERLLENMDAGFPAVRSDYQQRIDSPAAQAAGQHLDRLGSDPRYLAASGARAAALAAGPFGPAGIGAQAAIQGGVGAVQGALDRNAAYPDSDALDLLAAGGRAAVPAAMAGAGGAMLARGLRGAAGTLNAAADENRILATGRLEGDVEAMGPQARAELARGIEDAGMHRGAMGMPQSIKGYARAGADQRAQGLARMKAPEDAIAQLPPEQQPMVPVQGILDEQRAAAARQALLADPANVGPAAFRRDFANRLEADTVQYQPRPAPRPTPGRWADTSLDPVVVPPKEPASLPWPRALEQRRNIDQNASWLPTTREDSASDAIRKEVAGGLRSGIDTAIDSPGVAPELAAEWRAGRDQFALGSSVAEPALKALDARSARPVLVGPGEVPSWLARNRGNSMLAGIERSAASASEAAGGAADLAGRTAGLWDWLRLKLRTGEDTTDASDIYRDVGRGPRNDFGGM